MSLPSLFIVVSILIEPEDGDYDDDDDDYIRGVSYLHDHNIVHLDLKVSKAKHFM